MNKLYKSFKLTGTAPYKSFEKLGSLNFVETAKTNSDLVTDAKFEYNQKMGCVGFKGDYIYSGQYDEEGNAHGMGSMLYFTGKRKGELYQGTFVDSQLQGRGLLILYDGTMF